MRTILRTFLALAAASLCGCTRTPSAMPGWPPATPAGMGAAESGSEGDHYLRSLDRVLDRLFADLPGWYRRRPERFRNDRIPFATALLAGQVAVYDVNQQDVTLFPGAGLGVRRIGEISPGRFIYMQGFVPRCYDQAREESIRLFDPQLVGGFVLVVLPDAYSNLYCLAATSREDALQDRGQLYELPSMRPNLIPIIASRLVVSLGLLLPGESIREEDFFPWDPVAQPRSLSKVNAVAVQHGLIQTFRLTLRGELLVFATRDGNLFEYTPLAPAVAEIRTNREFGQGRAAFPTLEVLTGRRLAWEDLDLKQIFLLDRANGLLEALPMAPFLEGDRLEDVAALVPNFIGIDPFDLYVVKIRRDGSFREYRYDLLTGTTYHLGVLNDFLASRPLPATASPPTEDDLLAGVAF